MRAIEDEERKRKEVKEIANVAPPSHRFSFRHHYLQTIKKKHFSFHFRSNFSMCAHPDNPEIVFFGGEFYNGQKVQFLFIYFQ